MAFYCMVLSSCNGRTSPKQDFSEDSIDVDSTDSNNILSSGTFEVEANVPKAADEYFNDFIYSFTTNHKFQMKRIVFPLPYEKNGKLTYTQRNQWRFNPMHTKQEFYTVFFDKESSLELEKSPQVKQVTIEYMDMIKEYIKDYFFSREDDQWKLRKIREYSLEEYHDREFLLFFDRFVSDSLFQLSHLASKIEISMPDPDDDFETLTGTIGAEQWTSFRPELPRDYFYNIDYGQNLASRKFRVVALEGSSNGFLSLLFFRQKDYNEWVLYKMKG